MRKLPDLSNTDDMISRGRRSALMSARNEACQAMRDACVEIQSLPLGEESPAFIAMDEALDRLRKITKLWAAVE